MTRPSILSVASLGRLLALARDLMQAPDVKSVLELVRPAIHELLGADRALLLVQVCGVEYAAALDDSGPPRPAREESLLYACARQVMEDGAPLLLPDVAAVSHSLDSCQTLGGGGSLLALPFPPVEPIGVLAVLWNRKEPKHRLARRTPCLRYLGELTGAALGSLELRLDLEGQISAEREEIEDAAQQHEDELRRRDAVEDEIRRISITDVLTGTLNRRGFFLRAEESFRMARSQGRPSLLIFADIDALKTVNDRLGHEAGDRLIQDGASILRRSFREGDVVARLGGDEFAALTLELMAPGVILARIQENIEDFHQRFSRPYRVSFSIGMVQCDPLSDLTLSDYLTLADQRMYAQKIGRSR